MIWNSNFIIFHFVNEYKYLRLKCTWYTHAMYSPFILLCHCSVHTLSFCMFYSKLNVRRLFISRKMPLLFRLHHNKHLMNNFTLNKTTNVVNYPKIKNYIQMNEWKSLKLELNSTWNVLGYDACPFAWCLVCISMNSTQYEHDSIHLLWLFAKITRSHTFDVRRGFQRHGNKDILIEFFSIYSDDWFSAYETFFEIVTLSLKHFLQTQACCQ